MAEIALKVLGLLDLLIIISGTIGNLLIMYVGYKNRGNNTFIFLIFLALFDLVSLYWWNLNHFVTPFFNLDLQNFNVIYCKIMQFFQFSSLQLSAWFLVLISVERYVSVVIGNNWANVYFKSNRAFTVSLLFSFFILVLNFHVLLTFAHVRVRNETQIINNITTYVQVESVECYSTKDTPSSQIMHVWTFINGIFYSYIPFLLLAIFNFLLILKLHNSHKKSSVKSASASKRNKSINRTVLSITFLFIAMTLPASVTAYFYDTLLQTENGRIILYLGDGLDLTYHALNFFILFFTNRKFYKTVMHLFGKNSFGENTTNTNNTISNIAQNL